MEIVYRAAFIFFFLWFPTRALGKRELMQMSAFELIVLVTMGDLVQQAVTQEDMSITGAVLSVGTLGLLSALFGWISYRFKRTQPVIEGMPVLVVRDGKVLTKALDLERMPENELREAARSQGIDDLGKVRLGIIEPDGRLSFLTNDDDDSQSQPDDDKKPV